MKNTPSTTSYQAELEETFCLLKHIKLCGTEPTKVEQWCDKLRAIRSTDVEIWSPKGISKPDADIILAIHHLKKDLPNVKECKHVYVHKDTRNVKKPTEAKQKERNDD